MLSYRTFLDFISYFSAQYQLISQTGSKDIKLLNPLFIYSRRSTTYGHYLT
jgi:hypothetical protein